MMDCDSCHSGDEAEILGHRLDLARDCLKKAQRPWAQNYWNQVVSALMVQWKNSPAVNHGQNLARPVPKWTVKFDFFETEDSIDRYDLARRIFDGMIVPDLDACWERERMRKLVGGS